MWYLLRNGSKTGPYDDEAIGTLVRENQIRRADLVWREGQLEWVRADTVAGLFAPPPTTSDGSSAVAPAETSRTQPPSEQQAPLRRRRGGYMGRHWRGELSLAVAYWINGIATALVVIAASIGVASIDVTEAAAAYATAAICFLVARPAVSVWWIVGVWRSAVRAKTKANLAEKVNYWAALAQLVLVFSALGVIANVTKVVIPQIIALSEIAIGGDEESRFRVRVLRNGTELELVGEIGFGSFREVNRILESHPGIKLIHLNSMGGRVAEAERLARLIERKGLDTYVATQCLSACVQGFAAGRQRWISREAKVGLHQPYFPGMTTAQIRDAALEAERFLVARGVDPKFARKGYSKSHDQMWYPTHAEIFRARLGTGYGPPGGAAISGLPAEGFSELEGALKSNKFFSVLAEREPETFKQIAAGFRNAWQQGRSIDELRAEITPTLIALYRTRLPHASDSDISDFFSVVLSQYRYLQSHNVETCAGYARGSTLLKAGTLPSHLLDKELEVAARVFRGSGTGGQRIPEIGELQPIIAPIVLALIAKHGDAAERFFDEASAADQDAKEYCDVTVDFYALVLALPDKQRSLVLRFLSDELQKQK